MYSPSYSTSEQSDDCHFNHATSWWSWQPPCYGPPLEYLWVPVPIASTAPFPYDTPNNDKDVYDQLKEYVLTESQLQNVGYPFPCPSNPRLALVTKQSFRKGSDEARGSMKSCVRCGDTFTVQAGVYLTREKCHYHWGKLRSSQDYKVTLTCCEGAPTSTGCCVATHHVWSGLEVGVNGPLEGFVQAYHSSHPACPSSSKIFGLDCEMAYTAAGLELTRVTLVALDGAVVYDTLVLPELEIVDYNTRFSGICRESYLSQPSKSLSQVQHDLLGFVSTDTVLVGHALENDLRALKMIHTLVVDTSLVYPHQYGFPYRRSLKELAEEVLGATVQTGHGHDSAEDARTSLSLALERVRKDTA